MNNQLDALMDRAVEFINEYDNIFICSHVQPDGDNIGSTLALYMAIKKKKENVKVVKTDEIPSDYLFLPNIQVFKEYSLDEQVDLFISLDSSDVERLGPGKELLKKAKKIINIDHHVTNNGFGDINIVLPSASATGEIVYKFIKHMDVEIDKDIATCLYTA
ncbi:MAG: DHH family phosphoesterase, partial [Tissierellales bacterium]